MSSIASSHLPPKNEKKESKLVKLFKDVGYSDEQVATFFIFMQPAIDNFIQNKMFNALTDEEIEDTEKFADEKKADDYKKMLLLTEYYNDKTGRNLENEIDEFIDSIADKIQEIFNQSIEIYVRIMKANVDDRTKLLEELIDRALEDNLKKV